MYATNSASMTWRRSDREEVKPAVKAVIWFPVRTTATGWKRREREGVMVIVKLICSVGVV